MRNRVRGVRWWLVLCLLGAAAPAHELELDLTGPEVADSVAPAYRPSLAVLEVVALDLASIDRARQLEVELLAMLASSEQLQPVRSPAEVKALAADLDSSCSEPGCFEAARARLDVQRVARLTVEEQGAGSLVTLLGFDPLSRELTRTTLEVEEPRERFRGLIRRTPAERDVDFLRKVMPQLRAALRPLTIPNGRLIIENGDPGLAVSIDGAPAGRGRLEVIKPPGQLMISTESGFYEPFARVVTVEPAQTVTIGVRLVAKPVAPVVVRRAPYRGLMTRPGTYLALTGLTAVGVGLGLGLATAQVQERLAAGGFPVQVTRTEAMRAPGNALLANLLMGTGAALAAGGTAWVALTPTPRARVDEPLEPGVSAGWTLVTGGSF